MFDSNMKYEIFRDYNISFDEKGSTCGTVRLVQWVKDGAEPDINKAKLEIRKIYTSGVEEKTGKGYTFATENGPHELVEGLLGAGFGGTKECLRKLAKRDDFKDAVENINADDDGDEDGEMFDMRDLLLSIDTGEDDDNETA